MERLVRALGIAGLGVLAATPAAAETIRATSGFGPAHVIATAVYPEIGARLSSFTDSRWNLTDTPAGLVAPNEMNAALRDGVSDMGAMLMPYFLADFPASATPAELLFVGADNLVVSAAVTEFLVTCGDCQAEFAANGQVYLGSDATPPYNLLSTRPIRSADDLKGMRIRTGAPLFAGLIAELGGEATQIPSSELFEALSQGVVDGTFSGSHEIIANRLGDVVKYVTEIEEGMFNSAAIATASRLLWDRMAPEDRSALARAAQYGVVKGLFAYREQAQQARAIPGIDFIAADDSLRGAKDAYNRAQLAAVADTLTARGVSDAQAKVDRYLALVEKWRRLVTPGMTAEQLAELRYSEIFAGIDIAAYGE